MDYPKSVPGVGLVDGRFVNEDPATGQLGSIIPAEWGNALMSELFSVMAKRGVTPDETKFNQLAEVIFALATANAAGMVQLANAAEAAAGTNTTKAVTPSLLKQETDKRAPASHTHEMGQVLGLIAALAAKLNTAGGNPALTSSAGIELGLRAADGYGSYVKGYKGGMESWYVGTGTTNTDDVLLSSYIHNTYLRLMNDRVLVNRPLYVGNNVVYHAGNLPAAADATTTVKGIVQLATLAEANAGTNTEKAMTPALVRSIGIGQNWTDVTASRASGVVYTNTTGKPIFVCVCASTQISAVVSGIELLISQGGENNAYFIVQPGGGYMAISSNIRKWSELR